MNKDEVLNYLKTHKKYIFETFGLNKIALFGSVARGEESASSDIDILFEVENSRKFSIFEYLKLNRYLEENLKAKVDLIREAKLKQELKPYVKRDIVYV